MMNEMELVHIFEAYCDAVILRDTQALENILDDDFEWIERSGLHLRKNKMLVAVEKGLLRYAQMNTLDNQIIKDMDPVVIMDVKSELVFSGKHRQTVVQRVVFLRRERFRIREIEIK